MVIAPLAINNCSGTVQPDLPDQSRRETCVGQQCRLPRNPSDTGSQVVTSVKHSWCVNRSMALYIRMWGA